VDNRATASFSARHGSQRTNTSMAAIDAVARILELGFGLLSIFWSIVMDRSGIKSGLDCDGHAPFLPPTPHD
jgi:hypothetical protein